MSQISIKPLYNKQQYLVTTITIKDQVIKKDGTSPLYLCIKLGSTKKFTSLKMFWPAEFFDKAAQTLLPRSKKDQEFMDQNIILNTIKSQCNDIIRDFRLSQQHLDIDGFLHIFNNFNSREDFIFYANTKNQYLYEKGINTLRSKQRHGTCLNVLTTFMKFERLIMADLNLDFVRRFDAFLRKRKYKHNTITGMHKVVRSYVNHALEDGYRLQNPYKSFSLKFVPGDRPSLTIYELGVLRSLIDHPQFGAAENESLRKFLFSCYTGLRISDSNMITSGHIVDGVLNMSMVKGLRYGKEVRIKIPAYALSLIEGRKGQIFTDLADSTVNKSLKVIAAVAGLNKKLTFHVSRDTFATTFLSLGGDLASLKDLMGHSDIKTTQIYLKMSNDRKDGLMDRFDNL